MNPELIYFFKINMALFIFYGFYRLLFTKDTFFKWRRFILLGFLVFAFLYPLFNLTTCWGWKEPIKKMSRLYTNWILPEISIEPITHLNESSIIISLIIFIYGTGILMYTIRFCGQLKSLFSLSRKCPDEHYQGIKIFRTTESTGSFSFFRWIFLSKKIRTSIEINEIMTHELAHARQWHSLDIIISEIVSILCWINPFVWLIKKEIRYNLEYLADEEVLKAGFDCKSYQYHLVENSFPTVATNLSNNLNVLPLKSRINMMNKKRTSELGKIKYMICFPLIGIIMLVSSMETLARITEKTVPSKGVSYSIDAKDSLYQTVEQMPEYPGGFEAMQQHFLQNLHYPPKAIKENISGKVLVQFTVNKEGKVVNPTVVRSVSPELDAEALRVVETMPRWKPGQQKGEPVSVLFTIPVNFSVSSKAGKQSNP